VQIKERFPYIRYDVRKLRRDEFRRRSAYRLLNLLKMLAPGDTILVGSSQRERVFSKVKELRLDYSKKARVSPNTASIWSRTHGIAA